MTHLHSFALQLGPDGHGLLYGNYEGYIRQCKCGEYAPDYLAWQKRQERKAQRVAQMAPPSQRRAEAVPSVMAGMRLIDDGPLAIDDRTFGGRFVHGAPLSAREVEVLDLLARGYTQIELAALLGISYQTAKNHSLAILCKTGAPNSTRAAVLYALATHAAK